MENNINTDILAFGKERNPDEFPILALAYMGDAVMELFARDYVLNFSGEVRPAALVHASKAIITCEAQSDGVERILEHHKPKCFMLENVKKLFQATDMTEGTPWKRIVLFTVPMLLGNIAQQLYSTVDSIVVGHK